MIIAVIISISYNRYEYKHHNTELVIETLKSENIDPSKYIYCINMYKPVRLYHINKGDKLIQYQIPSAPQGNFYGFEGSTPSGLGISEFGYDYKLKSQVFKEMRVYEATKDIVMLSSYSAPVLDDWSTPKIETQTTGNEIQLFSTCKKCFRRLK